MFGWQIYEMAIEMSTYSQFRSSKPIQSFCLPSLKSTWNVQFNNDANKFFKNLIGCLEEDFNKKKTENCGK